MTFGAILIVVSIALSAIVIYFAIRIIGGEKQATPTRQYPIPVVCALIRDARNRVLLERHVYPERFFWDLPGGKVEIGESPMDAIQREIHEELGIDVIAVKLLDVRHHNTERGNWVLVFYECLILKGEVREGENLRWHIPGAYMPGGIKEPDAKIIDAWADGVYGWANHAR